MDTGNSKRRFWRASPRLPPQRRTPRRTLTRCPMASRGGPRSPAATVPISLPATARRIRRAIRAPTRRAIRVRILPRTVRPIRTPTRRAIRRRTRILTARNGMIVGAATNGQAGGAASSAHSCVLCAGISAEPLKLSNMRRGPTRPPFCLDGRRKISAGRAQIFGTSPRRPAYCGARSGSHAPRPQSPRGFPP